VGVAGGGGIRTKRREWRRSRVAVVVGVAAVVGVADAVRVGVVPAPAKKES